MGKAKPKTAAVRMPAQAQVGDKIRLRPERINEYANACKAAGWDGFDAYATKVVSRADPFNKGGGRRLFFDGPPFCYSSSDVKLAWSNPDERREMLRAAGWKV